MNIQILRVLGFVFLVLITSVTTATGQSTEAPRDLYEMPEDLQSMMEMSGSFPIEKWRAEAMQGDADAQNNLGFSYGSGIGVVRDQHEAVRWYRMAAKQGHAGAQYNLGFAYWGGAGIIQDKHEATRWFRKAAEQGHALAQYLLGHAYWEGAGVDRNRHEATHWLRKAAEQEEGMPKIFRLAQSFLARKGIQHNKTDGDRIKNSSIAQTLPSPSHDSFRIRELKRRREYIRGVADAARQAGTVGVFEKYYRQLMQIESQLYIMYGKLAVQDLELLGQPAWATYIWKQHYGQDSLLIRARTDGKFHVEIDGKILEVLTKSALIKRTKEMFK